MPTAAGPQILDGVALRDLMVRRIAQRMADAMKAGSVWLFSSSEALAALRALQPLAQWGAATALATHPRIAQAARDIGFGHVIESRPSLADVLRALESERSAP